MKSGLVGPSLLILLGIIFLLNNLGFLPWDVWLSLWRFWPVILILVGAEFILGKRASLKTIVILLALIFVAPVLFSLAPFSGNPLTTKDLKIDESLATATKAKISINLPASSIKVTSLEEASASLVEGKISYSELAKKPLVKREDSLGEAIITINQSLEGKLPFISNLRTNTQLSLTRLIPLELIIKTGATSADFDLTQLRVAYLEFETGASNIKLSFAKDFRQRVFIKGGASNIELAVPKELEARLKIDSQIKSADIEQRFKQEGNIYQTAGFNRAKNKLDIEIKAIAGQVVVKNMGD